MLVYTQPLYYEQVAIQGYFFSEVVLVWIQSFSSPRLIAISRIKTRAVLLLTNSLGRIDWFMPFQMSLVGHQNVTDSLLTNFGHRGQGGTILTPTIKCSPRQLHLDFVPQLVSFTDVSSHWLNSWNSLPDSYPPPLGRKVHQSLFKVALFSPSRPQVTKTNK